MATIGTILPICRISTVASVPVYYYLIFFFFFVGQILEIGVKEGNKIKIDHFCGAFQYP